MLESTFKKQFKQRVIDRFPELDLDFVTPVSRFMPDMIILGPTIWAALEFKRSESSPHRPNQHYHISRLNKKGFARFVFPENEEEVFHELEILFSS
jgi:hypothetical protein